MEILFEWDENKAKSNLKKHKVSFDEGIAMGVSVKSRLLVAAYTERGDKTRIISCRKATLNERKTYEKSKF